MKMVRFYLESKLLCFRTAVRAGDMSLCDSRGGVAEISERNYL